MAFTFVFGNDNILIGVTTITAMLMLMERDLTIHPIGNTARLIVLNLLIGVAGFLADFNMWLAIPINFITMFGLSYSLLYNLKNPLYLPFSLQYLFILAAPVALDQMPLRLASLVFGALAIMGLQMLFNRNRISKSGDKKIEAICTALIARVKQIKEKSETENLNETITADINSLRNMIYDKRERDYYLTEEGQVKLNISASLEKINMLLNTATEEDLTSDILDDLIRCLELVPAHLKPSGTGDDFQKAFAHILDKYTNEETHDLFVLSMLNHIDFLKDNLAELSTLEKEHYHRSKKKEHIPASFQKPKEIPKHTKAIKLSYAIRMAVGITIGGFIVDFFDISEGRWMMFTILSVVIPIYEHAQQKSRDRIFATIAGAILVTILFSIFQGNTARTVLIMLSGYVMNYIKAYRYSTILVTFTGIGSAALITGATGLLTLNRIALVVAGVGIAIIVNKFVMPYTRKDANTDLNHMYLDTIYEMLKELAEKVKGAGSHHGIKNLLLVTNLIEDRKKLLNQESKVSREEWLKHQRLAASTIYELFVWIDKLGVRQEVAATASNYLQVILNSFETEASLEGPISTIKDQIAVMHNIENRMVLNMILQTMEELEAAKPAYKGMIA